MSPDTSPKLLEFLRAVVPNLSRIALLTTDRRRIYVQSLQSAARGANVTVLPFEAQSVEQFNAAFSDISNKGAQALIVPSDSLFLHLRDDLGRIVLNAGLPSIFQAREGMEMGGPMSYGDSLTDFMRLAASYVDKILKGALPKDLPVEQPKKFELVINLKIVALGKARERRIRDESVKLLKEVQPVKVRPGQSLAGRPVASVASRRATGGCEAYTARKQAARVQLRHLV